MLKTVSEAFPRYKVVDGNNLAAEEDGTLYKTGLELENEIKKIKKQMEKAAKDFDILWRLPDCVIDDCPEKKARKLRPPKL